MGVLLGQGWHVSSEVLARGSAVGLALCSGGAFLGVLAGVLLCARAGPGQNSLRVSLFWMSCTLNGGLAAIAQIRLRAGRYRANDDALIVNSFLSSGLLGTSLPHIVLKVWRQPQAEVILPSILAVLATESVCSSEDMVGLKFFVSIFLFAVGLRGIATDSNVLHGDLGFAGGKDASDSSDRGTSGGGHEPFFPATVTEAKRYSPHFMVSRRASCVPRGVAPVPLISLVVRQVASPEPSHGGKGKGRSKDGRDSRKQRDDSHASQVAAPASALMSSTAPMTAAVAAAAAASASGLDLEEVLKQHKETVGAAEVGSDIRWDVVFEEMRRVDGTQAKTSTTATPAAVATPLEKPVEVFCQFEGDKDVDQDDQVAVSVKPPREKHMSLMDDDEVDDSWMQESRQPPKAMLTLQTRPAEKKNVMSLMDSDDEDPGEGRASALTGKKAGEAPQSPGGLRLIELPSGGHRGGHDGSFGCDLDAPQRDADLNGSAAGYFPLDASAQQANLRADAPVFQLSEGDANAGPEAAMWVEGGDHHAGPEAAAMWVEGGEWTDKGVLQVDGGEWTEATNGIEGMEGAYAYGDAAAWGAAGYGYDDGSGAAWVGFGDQGATWDGYSYDASMVNGSMSAHAAEFVPGMWGGGAEVNGGASGAAPGLNSEHLLIHHAPSLSSHQRDAPDGTAAASRGGGDAPAVDEEEDGYDIARKLLQKWQSEPDKPREAPGTVSSLMDDDEPDPGTGRAYELRREQWLEERNGKGKGKGKDGMMPRTLWVGDVDPRMDEQFVAELFISRATVTNVKVIRDRDTGQNLGYAFVEFQSHPAAAQVLESFAGQPVVAKDGRRLRVNWATVPGTGRVAPIAPAEGHNETIRVDGKKPPPPPPQEAAIPDWQAAGSEWSGNWNESAASWSQRDGRDGAHGRHAAPAARAAGEGKSDSKGDSKGDRKGAKGKGVTQGDPDRGGDGRVMGGRAAAARAEVQAAEARADAKAELAAGKSDNKKVDRGAILERELQGLQKAHAHATKNGASSAAASREGARSGGKGKNAIDDPEILKSAKRWAYIDPNNDVHVGFTTEDMRQWFDLGYFEEGLKVALLQENSVDDSDQTVKEPPRREFYPLKQWFPEATKSFTCIPRC